MTIFLKKILILITKTLALFFQYFYPYRFHIRLLKFRNQVFALWISSEFKSFGDHILIAYPLKLIGGKYISIGDNVRLGERGILSAWDNMNEERFKPVIIIKDNTSIGEDFHITAINKIIIGKNVLMGKKITITDNSHGEINQYNLNKPPVKRTLYSKGPVVIEDNVWIGEKATILPGVRIGQCSIIGANSLVNKDIPPFCLAGGIPARIIKNIKNE